MILNAIIIFLGLVAFGFLYGHVSHFESEVTGMLSSMSSDYAHFKEAQNKINSDFADELDNIKAQLDDLPKEDLQAKYDAEKAWNEGIQAILNFGLDTNKGGNNA